MSKHRYFPMLPIRYPKSVRTLTQVALLVLALWPAPVPVGHRHSDFESRVSGQQLMRHLESHHGGYSCRESWPTDWHWHWVFPADGYVGLGDEEIATHPDPMIMEHGLQLGDIRCVSSLDRVALKQLFNQPCVPAARLHTFQNVALLSSRQSLPELLGIIRC